MKKRLVLDTGLILSLMFGSGAVLAGEVPVSGSIATIAQSEGMVLVNQGKVYVVARPGQQLNVGDRIMTMAGASASIAYKDGCVQQLKPNNKLIFNSAVECSTKTAKVQSVGPYYSALGNTVIDSTGGGGLGGGAATEAATGGGGVLGGGLGFALGAVSVGVIGAYDQHRNNDQPVSRQ